MLPRTISKYPYDDGFWPDSVRPFLITKAIPYLVLYSAVVTSDETI